MITRQEVFDAMAAELDHAYAKHGKELWGRHEFHSILMEEFEEVWDVIKKDGDTQDMVEEIVQVAAMCLRYLETGDRRMGPHPKIIGRKPQIQTDIFAQTHDWHSRGIADNRPRLS
jgi:NTP pyrophosphatase (non-canonical NTP hydrolase)